MVSPRNTQILVIGLLRGDTDYLKDIEDIDNSADDDDDFTEEEVEGPNTDVEVEQFPHEVLLTLGGAALPSLLTRWFWCRPQYRHSGQSADRCCSPVSSDRTDILRS